MNQLFIIETLNQTHPIRIQIINPTNPIINITGDKELCQLLQHYLPELKQHLKKKSVKFDNIIIEDDENTISLSTNQKKENEKNFKKL